MLRVAPNDSVASVDDGFHLFGYDDWYKFQLMRDYFLLREKVFVHEMGWDLACYDVGEFDQYDRAGAYYLLCQRKGKLVSGLRLAPTTTSFEEGGTSYSYMIRDAQRGLLDSIPANVIDEPAPVDPDIWEMTRVIAPGKPIHLKEIMTSAREFLRRKGAKRCLLQTRPVVCRLGRAWGFDISPIGKKKQISGGQYQAFKVGMEELQGNFVMNLTRSVSA